MLVGGNMKSRNNQIIQKYDCSATNVGPSLSLFLLLLNFWLNIRIEIYSSVMK